MHIYSGRLAAHPKFPRTIDPLRSLCLNIWGSADLVYSAKTSTEKGTAPIEILSASLYFRKYS